MSSGPTKPQLRRLLRERLAAAIPEGSGAEVRNLCDALRILEAKPEAQARGQGGTPRPLTVRFEGGADDFSL